MASLPVFFAATVDLVAELSEENKAVVPHFDLTQGSDVEPRSPTSAQVAAQPLSPTSSRDGDDVQCWPVLHGVHWATGQQHASVRCVGGFSSGLCGMRLEDMFADVRLRPTRWGRCEHC